MGTAIATTRPPVAASGDAGEPRRAVLASLPGPVLTLAVGVGYLGLSQYVAWLEALLPISTGLRPAVGVAVAALLLVPAARWPWVVVAVLVAETATSLVHGDPATAAVWWVAGSVVAPLVGALSVRRFAGARWSLVRVPDLLAFVVATAVLAPTVGAGLGAIGTALASGGTWWEAWPSLALGQSLGVLTVAPLLLTRRQRDAGRRTEAVALALLLVAVTVLVFGPLPFRAGLPFYLVAPPIVWACFRFGVRGTAWSITAVVHLANVLTAAGYGPFAGTAEGGPLAMHLFLTVLGATSFMGAALAEDLSDRAQLERVLRYQADHDGLTGLPNRAAASRWLEAALALPGGHLAVLLCDIDRFKAVNDDHGQRTGDQALVQIAARLLRTVGDGGTVARWSGDQFLVIVEGEAIASDRLAERILDTLAAPLDVGLAAELRLSASVGIATADAVTDVRDLLARADAAVDRAKQQGGRHLSRFDEVLLIRLRDRQLIERDLRPALDRGDLHCVYQPEIDLLTGEVVAFECLSRWDHPERGAIGPDLFIPVVETMGAAGLLFDHVLRRALETQTRWATRLGFRPVVSVNLSARQLSDRRLAATVATALTRATAPAASLWLEVTETATADDPARAVLGDLHELGVGLAIDDFGTGWSSMSRLSAFPWDALKIDRSFVSPLGVTRGAEHVVRATIDMAHALGMRTVAEGVETAEQARLLAVLGCDVAQGYHYARPLHPRDAGARVDAVGRWIAAPADVNGR